MTQLHLRIAALVVVVALVAGCGASRSYGRGQSAAKAGNWDVAVEQYRQAVQQEPGNTAYRIALDLTDGKGAPGNGTFRSTTIILFISR